MTGGNPRETDNNLCSPIQVYCAYLGICDDPEGRVGSFREFFLLHVTSRLSEMGECDSDCFTRVTITTKKLQTKLCGSLAP